MLKIIGRDNATGFAQVDPETIYRVFEVGELGDGLSWSIQRLGTGEDWYAKVLVEGTRPGSYTVVLERRVGSRSEAVQALGDLAYVLARCGGQLASEQLALSK